MNIKFKKMKGLSLAEVLVAMSKNFNANATGVLQTDANDDGVIYDL